MRRRAVLEGAVHAAKPLDDFLLAITGNLERFHHGLGTVIADAAGGDFIAIAGYVVLERLDGQRVSGLQRLKPTLRHRKRIVGEVDFLLLLVVFEHRKIDDPGEFKFFLVDQVQLLAKLGACETSKFPEFFGIAGDEESGITILQLKLSTDCFGGCLSNVVSYWTNRFYRFKIFLMK